MKLPLSKRILLGLTGKRKKHWEQKLIEIKKHKITEFALFLECYNKKNRRKLYSALLSSNIKKIPFVHLGHDIDRFELKLLQDNFKTDYFNIHENTFNMISRLHGFHKKILIEFNYDNKIPNYLNMEKVGGFCIDLSHFKAAQERWTSEFEYIFKRKKHKEWFIANHLNGYSEKNRRDIHTVKDLKEFNYLKTLPPFLFGKYIAFEMFNPISEQIEFKEHILKLLKKRI